jgi:hypothetical protein
MKNQIIPHIPKENLVLFYEAEAERKLIKGDNLMSDKCLEEAQKIRDSEYDYYFITGGGRFIPLINYRP